MSVDDMDTICSETGATALFSLQSDECRSHFDIDYGAHHTHAVESNIVIANVPMQDFNEEDQRRVLPAAVRCLRDLLAAEHKVYMYCTAGINLAPLVTLGYLTFVERQPPEDALAFIRESRPIADPSVEAYSTCRQDLTDLLRERILVRAYYLSQALPDRDAADNWADAERDMIRAAFLNGGTHLPGRLDPSRD